MTWLKVRIWTRNPSTNGLHLLKPLLKRTSPSLSIKSDDVISFLKTRDANKNLRPTASSSKEKLPLRHPKSKISPFPTWELRLRTVKKFVQIFQGHFRTDIFLFT